MKRHSVLDNSNDWRIEFAIVDGCMGVWFTTRELAKHAQVSYWDARRWLKMAHESELVVKSGGGQMIGCQWFVRRNDPPHVAAFWTKVHEAWYLTSEAKCAVWCDYCAKERDES